MVFATIPTNFKFWTTSEPGSLTLGNFNALQYAEQIAFKVQSKLIQGDGRNCRQRHFTETVVRIINLKYYVCTTTEVQRLSFWLTNFSRATDPAELTISSINSIDQTILIADLFVK